MKALSFYAPWLWCTLNAGKLIDNRKQAWKYRGPLLLHASREFVKDDYVRAMHLCADITGSLLIPPHGELQRGGIMGRAELVDVIPPMNTEIGERFAQQHGVDLRWWFRDHCGLILANVTPLPLVPCAGALGLWNVPPRVIEQLGVAA